MAENYNPRRQPAAPAKRRKPSGASPNRGGGKMPAWAWLLAGVAVGLFVSFLVKLANMPDAAAPVALPAAKVAPAPVKPEPAKAAAPAAPAEDAKQVTRFDFYTLLPEREVIVPNEREVTQTPPPAAAASNSASASANTASAAAAPEQLFLQAGSFRSPQEAERRRGQIAQLGLDARVESVVANGDTWYRVQTGPFVSREKLSQARDRLSAQGIESLLLRQKPAAP